MVKGKRRTATQIAAETLRAIVMDAPDGALIGSEDSLVTRLESSRSTVRQVARLLEREGLLKVRRGINGGYFGTRPTAETIESTLCAHLEALKVDARDTTTMATALWVVAVRAATEADPGAIREMRERLSRKLKALSEKASFTKVRELEMTIHKEIFALAQNPYIKLIFDVNAAFSRHLLHFPTQDEENSANPAFVQTWREAKLMELNAMVSGNADLAGMAAQHSRAVWLDRIRQRHEIDLEEPHSQYSAPLHASRS